MAPVLVLVPLMFLVSSLDGTNGLPEIVPPEFIIGGNTTDIKQHPYQVAIWSNSDFRGSGALVGRGWAITTASVIVGFEVNTLRVRAHSSFASSGGKLYNVSKVVIHPKFRFSNMSFDVALLKLRLPFLLTPESRHPLSWWTSISLAHNPLLPNTTAVLSGWGSTSMWTKMSDQLLQTFMRPVNQTECLQAYASPNWKLSQTQFCALAIDVYGPCWGDSADLLVYKGRLYGLLSFNQGCYDQEVPSVFTDTTLFYHWVLKVIKR